MTAHQTAAAQTYRGLLRFARRFLDEAAKETRDNLDALAQSHIDLAQLLLDLTPVLHRTGCIHAGRGDRTTPDDWVEWKKRLADAMDVASWPTHPSNVELHAKVFLERVALVRWGDPAAMLVHRLPALTRFHVRRVCVDLGVRAQRAVGREPDPQVAKPFCDAKVQEVES